MTISCGIDIKFKTNSFNPTSIIQILIASEWEVGDEFLYLPKGDIDFDWQTAKLHDWETIINLTREKESLGEIIGLNLRTKSNTECYCSFLFVPKDTTLSVSINSFRQAPKKDKMQKIIDFQYFEEKIIAVLNRGDKLIESANFYQESDDIIEFSTDKKY